MYDRKWKKSVVSKKITLLKNYRSVKLYDGLKKILGSPNNSKKN